MLLAGLAADSSGVADDVHQAVEEAGLDEPVVVGHSFAAGVATVYAARHPTSGVVNVDQPLQIEPFANMVRSIADQLRGPQFPAIWKQFADSMHAELLPPDAEELVRTTTRPDQDLVLAYWREVLDRPVEDIAEEVTRGMTGVRESGVPYLVVAGAELDPGYEAWLRSNLPQATVTVWPDSGHFPHLARPAAFAELLRGQTERR